MTPEERIEAVARAICASMGDEPDSLEPRGFAVVTAVAVPNWVRFKYMAEAAITATLQSLREPGPLSDEIMDSFASASRQEAEAFWKARIDTAIKEMS